MTMIRINLIAEKKVGTPKAVKKPSGQTSELQENLILIVCALLAIVAFFGMRKIVKDKLNTRLAKKAELQKKYDGLKHWQDKKLEYEMRKELLNEKIQRITSLRDDREGPVKLMQDVANVLPESVWLSEISQGYKNALTKPSGKKRASGRIHENLDNPRSIRVKGLASSTEAVTNFAGRILKMDSTYHKTDLNVIKRQANKDGGPQEYSFTIYFEIRSKAKPKPADDKAKPKPKKGS